MSQVLVLNAGYEPLHSVSVRHAINMLMREVAVIEEAHPDENMGPFPKPRVLRLVRYVSMRWRHSRQPRWTRSRLFSRDGGRCAYCSRPATTVDHIVPQARGGGSTWLNTVASCLSCNSRKGCRNPDEAGMKLLIVPRVPTWWDFDAQQIVNG